jgi:hypothetical protein
MRQPDDHDSTEHALFQAEAEIISLRAKLEAAEADKKELDVAQQLSATVASKEEQMLRADAFETERHDLKLALDYGSDQLAGMIKQRDAALAQVAELTEKLQKIS